MTIFNAPPPRSEAPVLAQRTFGTQDGKIVNERLRADGIVEGTVFGPPAAKPGFIPAQPGLPGSAVIVTELPPPDVFTGAPNPKPTLFFIDGKRTPPPANRGTGIRLDLSDDKATARLANPRIKDDGFSMGGIISALKDLFGGGSKTDPKGSKNQEGVQQIVSKVMQSNPGVDPAVAEQVAGKLLAEVKDPKKAVELVGEMVKKGKITEVFSQKGLDMITSGGGFGKVAEKLLGKGFLKGLSKNLLKGLGGEFGKVAEKVLGKVGKLFG